MQEPDEIRTRRVEQTLEVAAPLFQIGFKGRAKSYRENILAQVTGELVCDLIAGESTALYRELYDEGLINAVFDTEVMAGPNYLVNIFSGESRDPGRRLRAADRWGARPAGARHFRGGF